MRPPRHSEAREQDTRGFGLSRTGGLQAGVSGDKEQKDVQQEQPPCCRADEWDAILQVAAVLRPVCHPVYVCETRGCATPGWPLTGRRPLAAGGPEWAAVPIPVPGGGAGRERCRWAAGGAPATRKRLIGARGFYFDRAAPGSGSEESE